MGNILEASDALGFEPFNSELDWQIAEWAIKDSISHNFLDRLLAIPGISHTKFLNFLPLILL